MKTFSLINQNFKIYISFFFFFLIVIKMYISIITSTSKIANISPKCALHGHHHKFQHHFKLPMVSKSSSVAPPPLTLQDFSLSFLSLMLINGSLGSLSSLIFFFSQNHFCTRQTAKDQFLTSIQTTNNKLFSLKTFHPEKCIITKQTEP